MRPSILFSCFPTAAIAVLLPLFLGTATVVAQDGVEQLRRRNELLVAKVADLESALAAARARIEALEHQLAAGQPPTPAAPNTVAAPTIEGEANPSQFEATLRAAYTTALAEADVSEGAREEFREHGAPYQRWLQKWIAGADRTFRRNVEWVVILEASEAASRTESFATLSAWDATTNERIGKPFQVRVPTRTLARIARATRTRGEMIQLVLSGVYTPHLQFNATRIDRGPFDNPPFIGPMIELKWSFDAKSLTPKKLDAVEESPTP